MSSTWTTDTFQSLASPSQAIDETQTFMNYFLIFPREITSSKVNRIALVTPSILNMRPDYGCALQREILIQGRLYISENHICFHANIFGWITDVRVTSRCGASF